MKTKYYKKLNKIAIKHGYKDKHDMIEHLIKDDVKNKILDEIDNLSLNFFERIYKKIINFKNKKNYEN